MSAKILVVDDEADFVELISFNLKQEGYEVITANTGLDGLFKARCFLPDLIVLDLMMEGIDGYSVCEILRRQLSTKTMPIIIVTAIAGQLARLNGLAVGADDFLSKSCGPRELLRRVADVLQRHAEQVQAANAEPE